jgi:general L-amino acid transport system substrate-binding protein
MKRINLKLSIIAVVFLLLISGCRNSKQIDNTLTNSNTGSLNRVKNRGNLICGVNGQLPGFSFVNENGKYSGIDVDLCRAVAAALFDDPSKVKFRNLDAQKRFAAVKSGEVDLLSRNTTWNLNRDTFEGMEFAPTTFYDGQGLLVTNASNIEKIEDLDGKSVCVMSGTTNEQNLGDRMRKLGLNYFPVVFEDVDRLYIAYEQGRCQAATSDRSQLIVRRAGLEKPEDHKVLELVLSKEPLGSLTADGDHQWFDVVKWVTYAMIQAEQLGINSQNVASLAQTEDPKIKRFLGTEGNLGKDLGLSNDFAWRIVKHVGNYGEVYDRNIGKPFGLERGLNALSTDGGLIYSPPFR